MASKGEQWIERESFKELKSKVTFFFKSNRPHGIALLGQSKTGKTSLLKRILKDNKEVNGVYIDLDKIGLSPESFSVEFVGTICYNLQKNSPKVNFFDMNFLLTLEDKSDKKSFEFIKIINNELLKIKPDQKLLVKSAFNFLSALAADKKLLIALDNFENIFDLNNFSQIKNISSLINFKQKNVLYIVASSSINQVKNSFGIFDILELKNFDNKEINTLLKKYNLNEKTIEKIKKFTDGNPYLLDIIKEKIFPLKEEKFFIKSFFNEFLNVDGQIYQYCSKNLKDYLNKTSGQTLSKIILKVISASPGLRLTEIAKKIYRPAPVTKSLIERLIASDSIYKKDNRYYLQDSVLALWLRLISQGYEFDNMDEITDEKIKEILDRI